MKKPSESFVYTSSTAVAAALVALGYQLKSERALVRTFTTKRPPGTLGNVILRLEPGSPNFPNRDGMDVMRQWFDRSHGLELDKLRDKISQRFSDGLLASASDPANAKHYLEELQQHWARLQEVLPGAILCFLSQAEENRLALTAKIVEMARSNEDRPMRRIDHDNGKGGYTLVPHDMPEDEVAKIVLKARRKH
jgi:hypothetical protein